MPLTAPPDGLYLEKIYLSPEELIQEYGKDVKIHYKNRWKTLIVIDKSTVKYMIINGIVYITHDKPRKLIVLQDI